MAHVLTRKWDLLPLSLRTRKFVEESVMRTSGEGLLRGFYDLLLERLITMQATEESSDYERICD